MKQESDSQKYPEMVVYLDVDNSEEPSPFNVHSKIPLVLTDEQGVLYSPQGEVLDPQIIEILALSGII